MARMCTCARSAENSVSGALAGNGRGANDIHQAKSTAAATRTKPPKPHSDRRLGFI